MESPTRTWVRFFPDAGSRFDPGAGARVSRYTVRELITVKGGPIPDLASGRGYLRVETPASWMNAAAHSYHGVTEHLHYTTEVQRRVLEEKSAKEFAPSARTVAVLIPIAKNQAWWNLAQDTRNSHFQKTHALEGHTEIGLRLTEKVYRKLYHSRSIGDRYDFLTYFEFDAATEPEFKLMLKGLRDTQKNPEWGFVSQEFEIWMTKTG